jgi:hypothetical protein
MTTTRNLAPYPSRAEDVTADNLSKHWTVCAQRDFLATQEAADLDRNLMAKFVYEWSVVFLLREVQERAGTTTADRLARDLWEALNDGSHLGECLWEWLTEYGIDPATVNR